MRGMAVTMPRIVLRPSKPQALFVAAATLALMIFGIVQMVGSGEFQWFFVFWVAIGLVIIVSALVQGFARPSRAETGQAGMRPVQMPGGRPMAVAGAVVGVGILTFGWVQMRGSGNTGFQILWIVFGVAIITFNLWSAFSRRGGHYVAERRDR